MGEGRTPGELEGCRDRLLEATQVMVDSNLYHAASFPVAVNECKAILLHPGLVKMQSGLGGGWEWVGGLSK